jgi:DNA-binding response OmpR family regulator
VIWLIAEDEADILNLVATMCQVWGHSPMTFDSGQKVWDWLDEVEAGRYNGPLPQFALLDIRMPGKRGNEVANRMRQVATMKQIPIALMTAFGLSSDERTAMLENDGVDYIINKPLPSFEELRTLLQRIIDSKTAAKNEANS